MAQPYPEPPHPEIMSRSEWDSMLAELRARHPDASDGILFCVFKLQQDPAASLKDFREEARLHGLSVSGRSLHSAKQLLGLTGPAAPRRRSKPDSGRHRREQAAAKEDYQGEEGPSLEDRMIDTVRQIQESATSQSRRLRAAMQEAIRILQRALDE